MPFRLRFAALNHLSPSNNFEGLWTMSDSLVFANTAYTISDSIATEIQNHSINLSGTQGAFLYDHRMRLLEGKNGPKFFLGTLFSLVFFYLLSSGPVIGLVLALDSSRNASPEALSVLACPYAPIFQLATTSTSPIGKCLCLYINVWIPADAEMSAAVFLK